MGDNKEIQWGIILVIISVIFLMAGLDMFNNQIIDRGASTLISFVTVAIGVFFIGKNS
jgi:hypothetical protein